MNEKLVDTFCGYNTEDDTRREVRKSILHYVKRYKRGEKFPLCARYSVTGDDDEDEI